MKILVPIAKVPDTTAKISFSDGNTRFNEDGVQFIMNPTDEWYALVRAIELKEQHGGSVTIIHMGPQANDQIIRKGLAIGADNAIRIEGDPKDAFHVAQSIVEHAKAEGYDLVLAGKETIDYNGFQVGPMIAEMLDMPFVGLVVHMDCDGSKATIKREVEGGIEESEVSLPMVLGASKGLAEQRIPNMRGIMAARTKPLTVVPAAESSARTQISSFELPPQRESCKMIDPENTDELVRLLHEEAKVI